MSKRGDNIYKRKDGRWEGRYIKEYIDGKAQYGYLYGKTYKETKEKLLIAINKSGSSLQVINKIKFKDISEEWLSFIKPQLKESSIVKYNNILSKYLYPNFENRVINYITQNDITDFYLKLLNLSDEKKDTLSPKTISSIFSVLKNIFEYAAKNKNIDIADFKFIVVKQNPKPMRILSIPEQERLSAYLCEDMNLSNLGILICMYTGIRIGEVCALKWEDISFDEHYIFVNKTMQRIQSDSCVSRKTKVVITEPKSNCSIRKIPIPDNIYKYLIERKQQDGTFLLTGRKDVFLEPRTLQNRFKSIIKKCAIEDANFHALRHTFATRCIELGFDVKSLSEILGHASVNITLNRYVHPSMELKQKNMNLLSNFLAVK